MILIRRFCNSVALIRLPSLWRRRTLKRTKYKQTTNRFMQICTQTESTKKKKTIYIEMKWWYLLDSLTFLFFQFCIFFVCFLVVFVTCFLSFNCRESRWFCTSVSIFAYFALLFDIFLSYKKEVKKGSQSVSFQFISSDGIMMIEKKTVFVCSLASPVLVDERHILKWKWKLKLSRWCICDRGTQICRNVVSIFIEFCRVLRHTAHARGNSNE